MNPKVNFTIDKLRYVHLKRILLLLFKWINADIKVSFFQAARFDFLLLFVLNGLGIFWGKDYFIFFITIYLTIMLHELGHLYMLKKFGYEDLKMRFYGFFAFCTGNKEKTRIEEELWVYLGGPLPGIVIGLIFGMGSFVLGYNNLTRIATLVIIINGFNLLPVYPLDGGRILQLLFFRSLKNKIVILCGSLIFILLVFAFTFDPIMIIIAVLTTYELLSDIASLRFLRRMKRHEKIMNMKPGFKGIGKPIFVTVYVTSIILSLVYVVITGDFLPFFMR